MNEEQFSTMCDEWRVVGEKLAAAYTLFRQTKHELELAKANAWADGQVTGSNADARKAALYIIVEPFHTELVGVENVVMELEVQSRYLMALIEYAIWNGIQNPSAFTGIRELIDGKYN